MSNFNSSRQYKMYTETLDNYNNSINNDITEDDMFLEQIERKSEYSSGSDHVSEHESEQENLKIRTEPIIPLYSNTDELNSIEYAGYYDTQDDHLINDLNNDIIETKNTLRDNIGRLYNRGNKLETIKNTTQNLFENAQNFKNKSTSLKIEMWKKYAFHIISIIIIILLIITIIYILIKK